MNSSFQNYVLLHDMLSKVAREDEHFPPSNMQNLVLLVFKTQGHPTSISP